MPDITVIESSPEFVPADQVPVGDLGAPDYDRDRADVIEPTELVERVSDTSLTPPDEAVDIPAPEARSAAPAVDVASESPRTQTVRLPALGAPPTPPASPSIEPTVTTGTPADVEAAPEGQSSDPVLEQDVDTGTKPEHVEPMEETPRRTIPSPAQVAMRHSAHTETASPTTGAALGATSTRTAMAADTESERRPGDKTAPVTSAADSVNVDAPAPDIDTREAAGDDSGDGGGDRPVLRDTPEEPERPPITLRSRAEQEAGHFKLQPEIGRRPQTGITLMPDGIRRYTARDRMYDLQEADGGDRTLAVSVVDPSQLVTGQYPNIVAYARDMRHDVRRPSYTSYMIPSDIAGRALNIWGDRRTPLVTFTFQLDSQGNPVGVQPSLSVSHKPTGLSFDQMSEQLAQSDSPYAPYGVLAEQLLARRQEQGAIALYRPEFAADLSRQGGRRQFSDVVRGLPAHIASEMGVFLDTQVAAYMWAHGIPGIFRGQATEAEVGDVTEILQNGPVNEVKEVLRAARESLGPIYLSPEPLGYAPYGGIANAHVRSPFGSFEAFVNAANLAAHLAGRPLPFPIEELIEIIDGMVAKSAKNLDSRPFVAAEVIPTRQPALRGVEAQPENQTLSARVNAAFRVTTGAPREIVAEVEQRMVEGTLPAPVITTILFRGETEDNKVWNRLGVHVENYLREHPEQAIATLLHIAGTRDGTLQVNAIKAGRLRFTSTVTLTIGEVVYSAIANSQGSIETAQYDASRLLLRAIVGGARVADVRVMTKEEYDKQNTNGEIPHLDKQLRAATHRGPTYDVQPAENGFGYTATVQNREGRTLGQGAGLDGVSAERMAARSALKTSGSMLRGGPEQHHIPWDQVEDPVQALDARAVQFPGSQQPHIGEPEPTDHGFRITARMGKVGFTAVAASPDEARRHVARQVIDEIKGGGGRVR